jgi:hypothetical protein
VVWGAGFVTITMVLAISCKILLVLWEAGFAEHPAM